MSIKTTRIATKTRTDTVTATAMMIGFCADDPVGEGIQTSLSSHYFSQR